MANISSLSSVNLADNPENVYGFVLPIDTTNAAGGAISTQKITLKDVRQYILNSGGTFNTSGLAGEVADIALCTASGYVGIGTTTPLQKLHVLGGAYIDGPLTVTGYLNAVTTKSLQADKWTSGKTVTLTGAVVGLSPEIDGASNVTITTTLPASSIDGSKLVDDSVTADKIGAGAVLGDHIANEQITALHVSSATLSGSHIADESISITKFSPNTAVTAGEYVDPVFTINAAGIITNIITTAGGGGSSVYPLEVHVSTGGNLSGVGSINNPYPSIAHALSTLNADDTHVAVIVHPGVYQDGFTVTRPNTHIVGTHIADKYSSAVIDANVVLNVTNADDENVVSFSNLTFLNNTLTSTDMFVVSGSTDNQTVVLHEIAVRDPLEGATSSSTLFTIDNTNCVMHVNDCNIKSAAAQPLIYVVNGALEVTNSNIIAQHVNGVGVKTLNESTANIHRSNITAEDDICVHVGGESVIDITHSTLKGVLSNSTGVWLEPSSAAGLPKVTAINNIFNIASPGTGFAVRTAASAVFDHAFNTYLNNQTVLTGGTLSGLPTTFAEVSAAEIVISIITPIFDITSITLTRTVPFIQNLTDTDSAIRIEHPSISSVFTSIVSTDSESVTSINLNLADSTTVAMTSAGSVYTYTSSMSSGFDTPFFDDGTYQLSAYSLSSQTTVVSSISSESVTAVETLSAFTLPNTFTNLSFTRANSTLSSLSGIDENKMLTMYVNVTSQAIEQPYLTYDYTNMLSLTGLLSSHTHLTSFSSQVVDISDWNANILSSASAGGLTYQWFPNVWRGPAFTPLTGGTGNIILSSFTVMTQLSDAPTNGYELTSFTLSDFNLNSLEQSAYGLPDTFSALTGLSGRGAYTFNYTDNDDVITVQVISAFDLSDFNEGTLSLTYDFETLSSATPGTLNLNTTSYDSILSTAVVSTINLSAPLSAIPLSADILVNTVGAVSSRPGSFSLLLSTETISSWDAFTHLTQTSLTGLTGSVTTSAVSAYFDLTLEGVLSGAEALSGFGDIQLYDERLTAITTFTAASTVNDVFSFSVAGPGDLPPVSTIPFITNLSTGSAIPASGLYAVEFSDGVALSTNALELSVQHATAGMVDIFSAAASTSAVGASAAYSAIGSLTSISLPIGVLSGVGPLTGILNSLAQTTGEGDIGGIPITFNDQDTLYFNLSVTDPIIIPISCLMDTIIVTVTIDDDDDDKLKLFFNGQSPADFGGSMGANHLYMFLLSTPWISGVDDLDNSGVHSLLFSSTEDGIHNGGTSWNAGVTGLSSVEAPGAGGLLLLDTSVASNTGLSSLYYYCGHHAGMGGKLTFSDTCSADFTTSSGVSTYNAQLTSLSACSEQDHFISQVLFDAGTDPNACNYVNHVHVGNVDPDAEFRYEYRMSGQTGQEWPPQNGSGDVLVLGLHNIYTFTLTTDLSGEGFWIGGGLSSWDSDLNAPFASSLGKSATALPSTYVTNNGAGTSGATITLSCTEELVRNYGPRLFFYSLTGGVVSGDHPTGAGTTLYMNSAGDHGRTDSWALSTRRDHAHAIIVNACNVVYDEFINQYMHDNPISGVGIPELSSYGYLGWNVGGTGGRSNQH